MSTQEGGNDQKEPVTPEASQISSVETSPTVLSAEISQDGSTTVTQACTPTCEAQSNGAEVSLIKLSLLSRGFLVQAVWTALYCWVRLLVFWGWSGLFQYTQNGETVTIQQNTFLFDVIYVLRLSVSVIGYIVIVPVLITPIALPFWTLVFGAWASFRAIDHFLSALWVIIIGNKGGWTVREGRPWLAVSSPYRLRRNIILILIDYADLILLYSALYALIHHADVGAFKEPLSSASHALQLSMSTLTTVGYGTCSPVKSLSVAVATLQTLTGLLILGGLLAAIIPMLAAMTNDQSEDDDRDIVVLTGEQATKMLTEIRIRRWVPPLSNIAIIGLFYFFLCAIGH